MDRVSSSASREARDSLGSCRLLNRNPLAAVSLIALGICALIIAPRALLAQPLAINLGGTGNTWGLPSQYAVVKNNATGTSLNKLAKYAYTYGPINVTAQTAAKTDTAIVGICIANCDVVGTFPAATIQTGGYANCTFDGTTTVGDFVKISSSVAGDCTDAGSAMPHADSPATSHWPSDDVE